MRVPRYFLLLLIAPGLFAGARASDGWIPVPLTPELVVRALDPALMCLAAYSDTRVAGWQGPVRDMGGLPLDDKDSGYHACYYTRTKGGVRELALAFRGTEMASVEDWKTDFLQVVLGELPRQYLLARANAQELKALSLASTRRGEPASALLTGHSLGGGLAEFGALCWGLQSVCFASAPIGARARETCGQAGPRGPRRPADFVTHIFMEGDYIPELSNLFGSHLGQIVSPALKPPDNLSGVDAGKSRVHTLMLAGLVLDAEKTAKRAANASAVIDGLARHSMSNYIEALMKNSALPQRCLSIAGAWRSRGSFFQVSSSETTFFLHLNRTVEVQNNIAVLGQTTRTLDHGFWDFDGGTLRVQFAGLATLHYQLRGAVADQGLAWRRTRVVPDEAAILKGLRGDRSAAQATLLLFRGACALMENKDVAWTRAPEDIAFNP